MTWRALSVNPFYEGGLNALDDPEFAQSFTDVYTHASLQVPWQGGYREQRLELTTERD
jgi:hypothetical protein